MSGGVSGGDRRERLEAVFQGALFTGDFLASGIADLDEYKALDDSWLHDLERDLRRIFERFPRELSPNESQTEDDLIWPVLGRLGWTAWLRQQKFSIRGREGAPDGLLFEDEEKKAQANEFLEGSARYRLGLALVESKRWERPLDRRSESEKSAASPQMSLGFSEELSKINRRPVEETAPSTQILRYLRRLDDTTLGKLRWGILTNGARWRLYWSGARSVSEQFFEADLARILNLPGRREEPTALTEDDRRHCLKAFALMFRREAFLPLSSEARSFHQLAMDEGRRYEERVAGDIFEQIFKPVFPELAASVAAAAPDAPLAEAREAALVVLYRLLFILYAEDRNLLPVRDDRYDKYSLRSKRDETGRRKDFRASFSTSATSHWSSFRELCRLIDEGDPSIGLPPYNGGLFDRARTPLLDRIELNDQIMANVIDVLSFEKTPEGRRYINYRDLGVQQLGSIYERLIEQELVRVGNDVAIRPNVFARKGSGSYYTPDDLVGLVIQETVGPLIEARSDAFYERIPGFGARRPLDDEQMAELKMLDPAERILELKICDPAMGSGHFLVNLSDYLADRVIQAMAEAEAAIEGYASPLNDRIEEIRKTIRANAAESGWRVDDAQLDDRRIVRRMVLKRCVYGVDKNPMAVELAKVSLWLHTFTVGAPLGFLDHHMRCGDSLFGSWVRAGIDRAEERGGALFLRERLERAKEAAAPMREIERLTDAEITEARQSAERFAEVEEGTKPLAAFLSFVHALDWLNIKEREDKDALRDFFHGAFGDPVGIVLGEDPKSRRGVKRLRALLKKSRKLMEEERFFGWQAAFPGVWSDWEGEEREGGFDAVVGNPPWDRMKLQQVEWFAARRPEIARARHKADRERMIADLEKAKDPLAREFAQASERSASAARVARACGDYPLLSGGDVNLYSLFVERAMSLVNPDGVAGLLTPSGIASDMTAAEFFKGVATEGRLRAFYDFENRKAFFPDVHASFKFCAFVAGPSPVMKPPEYAVWLHDLAEISDGNRRFMLRTENFARVNPNTGTAPVFRTYRDMKLTTAIYERLPILVDRSSGEEAKAWPVKYLRMLDMANDSGLFRAREELEADKENGGEGAWRVGGNRYRNGDADWVALYEGKMVQAFDHRAADVTVVDDNIFRTGQQESLMAESKRDFNRLPKPRYYVRENSQRWNWKDSWVVAFKDVTAATNMRTMIAAIIPKCGAGHTLPLLPIDEAVTDRAALASLMVANLNAAPFDFVARQKVPATHLTWYIVEQLPVVPPEAFEAARFGPKTAGEIVRDAVLELTYTAHDMAPFARDMGYADEAGEAKPPFPWDEERRLRLRAKLDAVFFRLYGVTDREDVRYVYSTFPIVEEQETRAHGAYRSRDLCLAWMSALAAGRPDEEVAG